MEMVLVTLSDNLRRQLKRGGLALLILLDLTAAFNVVDHDLLIHCLANVGVCGVALQWLYSFLWGQGQRVALGGQEPTSFPPSGCRIRGYGRVAEAELVLVLSLTALYSLRLGLPTPRWVIKYA